MSRLPIDTLAKAYNGVIHNYVDVLTDVYINCVVHGVYHDYSFALWCDDIASLSSNAIIKAAINACRIMNDDLNIDGPLPYCIWYPRLASQHTYRTLYSLHPHMKYSIARACVIANYVELYDEMNLLPEVNIMLEAYDANNMYMYNSIMSSCVKYYVMDDYNRRYVKPIVTNHNLNDTCTISMIRQLPQICYDDEDLRIRYNNNIVRNSIYFDIMADGCICSPADYRWYNDSVNGDLFNEDSITLYKLLVSQHICYMFIHVNKDVVVLHSAYHGSIDKYSIIRRPTYIPKEVDCLIHGIYYDYKFALWCRDNLKLTSSMEAAINARLIMSNDMNITNVLPYCIWSPNLPSENTCRSLVSMYPSMKYHVGRVCLIAGYELYSELDIVDDLCSSANACPRMIDYLDVSDSDGIHYLTFNRVMNDAYITTVNSYYDAIRIDYSDYREFIVGHHCAGDYIVNDYSDNLKDVFEWWEHNAEVDYPIEHDAKAISNNDILYTYYKYDMYNNGNVKDVVLVSKIELMKPHITPVDDTNITQLIGRTSMLDAITNMRTSYAVNNYNSFIHCEYILSIVNSIINANTLLSLKSVALSLPSHYSMAMSINALTILPDNELDILTNYAKLAVDDAKLKMITILKKTDLFNVARLARIKEPYRRSLQIVSADLREYIGDEVEYTHKSIRYNKMYL